MCFRCGSEDQFIENCPKLVTPNKKFYWTMEDPKTHAYKQTKIDKTSDNSIDESELQKIYVCMACIYTNKEIPGRDLGDRQQLDNCILESVATCHMTQEVSESIPGLLVERDKYHSEKNCRS